MSLTARIERLDRSLRVVPPTTLSPLPLETPADVLAVLTEAVNAARADTTATALEKARTLGLLAGVVLKVIEATDLATRLAAVERVLKLREADRRR